MDSFEQNNLLKIQSFIDKEIKTLSAEALESRRLIREKGYEFMRENPFGSVYGEAVQLVRDNEARLEKAQQMKSFVERLEEMRSAPFFGRVDFLYDGEKQTQNFYIGMCTLTDDDTREILVYDWRSPVSSLFYQGETGRASYKAPLGEITGEIKLLRQYTFADGEIRSFWDTQLHINDIILRDVLSGASSEKMKPIVCTIQREQNSAIRFDTNTSLAVFGPAGCGKTSIGMHRAAWLMYDMRSSGYTPSILMFTANEVFSSYISSVLPELGEAQLDTCAFYELMSLYLPDFTVESAMKQCEAVLCGNEKRKENISLLYSPDFISFIEEKICNAEPHFRDVAFFGKTVLSAEEISRRFSALPDYVSIKSRLETIADWVKESIDSYMLINRKELLSTVLHTTETGDSYTQRYKNLKENFLNKTIQMVLNSVEKNPVVLIKNALYEFYGENEQTKAVVRRVYLKTVFFEEALMLLYLQVLTGGCKLKKTPTHILIDEAQDMCVLQHKILKRMYPKAVFTVLGDINQGISQHINTSDEESICDIYACHKIKLNKSYRSTKQISEFAKRFLPEAVSSYETFERDGKQVQLINTKNYIKQTADIIFSVPDDYNSICVLVKTADEAVSLCKKLQKYVPESVAITDETKSMHGRVLCMPAFLSKGLEFDCVIIPEAQKYADNDRLMYLFTTRALHELNILYSL